MGFAVMKNVSRMERFWAPVYKTSFVIYCLVREAELRKGTVLKAEFIELRLFKAKRSGIGLSVEKNLQKDITI